MLCKEQGVRHGSMTAPTEEGDIGSESDISCPILCRVRLYCMADEANGFAVDIQDFAAIVQHRMRINIRIFVFRMTSKTDLSPVRIGPSPQEIGAPSDMVLMMTGQTLDLAVIEGERHFLGIRWNNIDRMVVVPVLMAVKAFR